MSIDEKFKSNLKISYGVTLYGIAFATSVLMIKEINEKDFLNAYIYY